AVDGGHPYVAATLGAQVSNAGEGDVGQRDVVALLRRVGEMLQALRQCERGVEFGPRRGRLRELHRGDVHNVAPARQLLAFTLDGVDGVPRCVAVGRDGVDAGHELGRTDERLETARVGVGFERDHRTLEYDFHVGGRGVQVLLAQPVVALLRIDAHDGIWDT